MLILLLLLVCYPATAQPEAHDLFATFQPASALTDARGVYSLWSNPGNLAFQKPIDTLRIPSPLLPAETEISPLVELTFAQPSLALFSSALDRPALTKALITKIAEPLTAEEKQHFIRAFTNSGLALSVQWLYGAGWARLAHNTAFGVAVRERLSAYLHFNEFLATLAFYGRKHPYFDSIQVIDGDTVGFATHPRRFSELFAGTILDFTWFREYLAGIGTLVLDQPTVQIGLGVNLKFCEGYSYLEARATAGQLRAYSAANPAFAIDYGKAVSPSLLNTTDLIPIGWGLGADFGFSLRTADLSLGIALLDVGFLDWEGNLFAAEDTVLNGLSSEGFRTLNLLEEIPQITGKGNFFKWHGLWRLRSWLPTRLYATVSFVLPPVLGHWKPLAASITVGRALNKAVGNLPQPIVLIGITVPIRSWLTLFPSFAAGGAFPRPVLSLYAHVELFDGIVHLRLGSADLLAVVLQHTPVLSANAALLDFAIPKFW